MFPPGPAFGFGHGLHLGQAFHVGQDVSEVFNDFIQAAFECLPILVFVPASVMYNGGSTIFFQESQD